ncbi:hypothetical protein D3C81_1289040 [compost metagenome]
MEVLKHFHVISKLKQFARLPAAIMLLIFLTAQPVVIYSLLREETTRREYNNLISCNVLRFLQHLKPILFRKMLQ